MTGTGIAEFAATQNIAMICQHILGYEASPGECAIYIVPEVQMPRTIRWGAAGECVRFNFCPLCAKRLVWGTHGVTLDPEEICGAYIKTKEGQAAACWLGKGHEGRHCIVSESGGQQVVDWA